MGPIKTGPTDLKMNFMYDVTETHLCHNLRPTSFRGLVLITVKSDFKAKPIKHNVLYSVFFDYSSEF